MALPASRLRPARPGTCPVPDRATVAVDVPAAGGGHRRLVVAPGRIVWGGVEVATADVAGYAYPLRPPSRRHRWTCVVDGGHDVLVVELGGSRRALAGGAWVTAAEALTGVLVDRVGPRLRDAAVSAVTSGGHVTLAGVVLAPDGWSVGGVRRPYEAIRAVEPTTDSLLVFADERAEPVATVPLAALNALVLGAVLGRLHYLTTH